MDAGKERKILPMHTAVMARAYEAALSFCSFNNFSTKPNINASDLQKREEAYKMLLKSVKPRNSYNCALIVQTSNDQAKNVFNAQDEEHWRKNVETALPVFTARAHRHNINDVSIAAAIFTDLIAEDCFVWITKDHLVSVPLRQGETAMIKMPPTTVAKQEMRLQSGRTITFTPAEPQYSQP